jgi:hypothetical protein
MKSWGDVYGKPKAQASKGGGQSKAKPAAEDHSGKAKAESEHAGIAAQQAKGEGEDIKGVVATHGPANKVEMEKHPEGGFKVSSHHGEHVHEHRADQFDEASQHAAQAFGEENPDQFEQHENAQAKSGESADIGGLGNLGSVVC